MTVVLPAGHEIGPYVLEGVAGEGGMGVVYRARDALLGRRVALKVLRREALEDAEGLPRFLREARIAAELKHPAIPAVYELSLESETPYLALEWVDGTTFRRSLDEGSLALRDKLRIVRTVAEVLVFAHEHGVIHRDVKPGNVMVGAQNQIRLLDFGMAKHASAAGRHSPLTFDTSDGSVLGTPRYMAPEQMAGEPIDARVDQFAWAAMTYEVLTGRPAAFSMRVPTDLFPFKRPIPCTELASDPARRALAAIVDRALSPMADERYPTMRALLDAWDLASAASTRRAGSTGRRSVFVIAAAVPLTLGAASALVVHLRSASPPPPALITPLTPSARMTDPSATSDAGEPSDPSDRTEPVEAGEPALDAAVPRGSAKAWAPDRGGRCFCHEWRVQKYRDGSEDRQWGPALCPEWAYAGAYGNCKQDGIDDARAALCHDPVTNDTDATCDDRYPATEGAPCTGYARGLDIPRAAKGAILMHIECTANRPTYAGKPRDPCRGLDERRHLVEGKLGCP